VDGSFTSSVIAALACFGLGFLSLAELY